MENEAKTFSEWFKSALATDPNKERYVVLIRFASELEDVVLFFDGVFGLWSG